MALDNISRECAFHLDLHIQPEACGVVTKDLGFFTALDIFLQGVAGCYCFWRKSGNDLLIVV